VARRGGTCPYVKIVRRALFVILIAAAAAVSLAAQDLGSSNKIFRENKAAARPEKKASMAPKVRKPKPEPTRPQKAVTKPVIKAASKPLARTPVRIAPHNVATAAKPPIVSAAAMAEYRDLIARGSDELHRGSLPEAESLFEHAAAIWPANTEAFASLGKLYSDSLRWDAAERSFRAAFALAPGDGSINLGLSRALAQPVVSADLYARYEEAERLARTAVRSSETAAAYDQLGMTLELRGLIGAETESAYRQAIAADRRFAPAYAHLARLLRRKGKAAEANAAYASATANAVNAEEMTAVAASFQSEQRYAESVPLLMAAIHLEPRNYAAILLLGRALTVTGDHRDAESHLIGATRLSPFSFAGFAELGRLYIREDKADMALSILDHGAQLADRFERLELARDLESLGDLFRARGNASTAATAYSRSLTFDPERPSTIEKLGRVRR
jgi:tetratricopeptide (TPR) repeat protein